MIFIGDIHGEWTEIRNRIAEQKLRGKSFIQVGEFGPGFQHVTDNFRQLDIFLQETNNILYITGYNHNMRHIKTVRNYEICQIEGRNVLFIGKDLSIDKFSLSLNSFFLDEDALISSCNNGIDIMVTHMAPSSSWPYTFSVLVDPFTHNDRNLLVDLTVEKHNMQVVLEHVKRSGCKHWFYGHYHAPITEEKDGIVFRCLDIGEMYEQ